MVAEFFLEIGSEDLPARFVPKAISDIQEIVANILKEEKLSFSGIHSYGTYRRLVAIVKGLSEKQEDREESVYGPPVSIAYDDNGNPTKAAIGFAKKMGVQVERLEKTKTNRGEVLFFKKVHKGRNTKDILPEIARKTVNSLSFVKTMRWSDLDYRFARPLRWFCSLYDSSVVSFEIAGIESSNKTYGHRFISPNEIEIESSDDYFSKLEKAGVIVDHIRRKDKLREIITQRAEEAGGIVVENEELLETLTFMVEMPGAVRGTFSEEFLLLPKEVLLAAIEKQQFYFPIQANSKEDGKLTNSFIAVFDRDKDIAGNIKKGNERVLKARLEDAKFFFEEDMKIPFRDRTEDLKGILFMENLGSMYEKVERICSLSKELAERIIKDIPKDFDTYACLEAARLCKNDLLTEMVQEFPELQGIMGREYLLRQGSSPLISNAVYEHYLPRFANDSIPASAEGAVIGLADRMDSIVGCFAKGLIPSGSEDPFGLRRAAIGIINIIENFQFSIDLQDFCETSLSLYGINDNIAKDTINKILEFFKTRYEGILDSRGYRMDLVNSVVSARFSDLNDATRRVDSLHKLTSEPWFESLSIAFKRAMKILPENGIEGEVDITLIKEDAEKELFDAVTIIEKECRKHLDDGNYYEALRKICEIRSSVDRFFDEVLVMTDDEKVRDNRLKLLKRIVRLFSDIADFRQVSSGK
ncbi:MAG: glycine--tRNA ligase subunit beta [Candidatus Schekmanbacteria bacterium]|nr:MAG: glycine--tRNA ligase subunit beta [Candidatus Schekmanbacteria bacterium]